MRSLQRGAVGALLVTTALAAAACGGSAAANGTTAATTSTSAAAPANGTNSAAVAKYTACLKQNGVTLPSFGAGRPPGGGAGGGGQGNAPSGSTPAPPTGTNGQGGQGRGGFANNPKFQKAAAACAKLRPTGLRGGGFGGANGQNTAAFAAYRNCLALHGVKQSALRPAAGASPTAKVQKAMTACASLRPSPKAPTSTTAAPTTTS
jgi:hypothetical protein